MGIILVEPIQTSAGEAVRETAQPAPYWESENARAEQVGPWRQDNVADSQSGVAITLGATDASAPTEMVAMRSGKIIAIAARSNADLVAGAVSFQATVGGTASGTAAALGDTIQQVVQELATPTTFAKGDRLGVKITTDGNVDPNTIDVSVWLLIKWDV